MTSKDILADLGDVEYSSYILNDALPTRRAIPTPSIIMTTIRVSVLVLMI